MTDLQQLLKESWELVEDDQEKLAGYFYARIFLSHPQVRDLFPATLDVQRAKLLRAILDAVQNFDDPDRSEDYLESLGRDHRKFRVLPEHYDLVGSALVSALRAMAGGRWTDEYDRAWQDAYRLVADRMQAGAAEDRNPEFWPAEVISHERRALDIGLFTVRPTQPLAYRAGQYVSIECGYQPRRWRVYSPANAPRKDNSIDFHVRAIGSGLVSSALVRRLKVGDVVRLAAPMGAMTLDRHSDNDIVCIAGGTGLAPIKALVDDLVRYNRTRWVHLFFGAKTREELYDLPAMMQLAARYPWLSIVPAVSDDVSFEGEVGNIVDVVRSYGPWDRHDFFIAGPPGMIAAGVRLAAELHVPSVRVRHDSIADMN